MPELQLAHDVMIRLLMIATTAIWPPVGTGAFWIVVGVYGVVSVLFDDETRRGIPGIEYLSEPGQELSKGELSKSGN